MLLEETFCASEIGHLRCTVQYGRLNELESFSKPVKGNAVTKILKFSNTQILKNTKSFQILKY